MATFLTINLSRTVGCLSTLGGLQNLRCISTTRVLNAEPPRKKRRIDPAVLKVRIERKIKKHEREIAKIEKEPRQLIPILEYQHSNSDLKDLKARPGRNMSDYQVSEGIFKAAGRIWCLHRQEQSKIQERSLRQVEQAQRSALAVLKQLDQRLYDETVSVDELGFIPYTSSLVRKETPPNKDYVPPDGHIRNVSKEWVM